MTDPGIEQLKSRILLAVGIILAAVVGLSAWSIASHRMAAIAATCTSLGLCLVIVILTRLLFIHLNGLQRAGDQRRSAELREETRLKILEGLATGVPLSDLLARIVFFVEQECPDALCSVLLADETGARLLHGVAPSLPDDYNEAVNGLKIGPGMGSCGTAAFRRSRVVVAEIEGHPYWKGFAPARKAGLRACWSEPVLSPAGDLLGTFAMYHREPRPPGEPEIQLIESAAHLASIAIARVRDFEARQRLEMQLRHMQKIEAIGQLAGGIAHDFNNLLTPIMIYADMIKRSCPEGHPDRKKIDGIIMAADKSRSLTQKLLSFGRKQDLTMDSLDLNEVVTSFQTILRSTVRENILIDYRLAPGGARIRADRGQIEQVMLNLIVNARDAISGNGRVVIETGHVMLDDEYVRLHPGMKSGPHVLLTFSDTGCGMDDETLQHIFEPFFTTKAIGQGTGLGLATVFGIVKQHEGYISVRSRVGAGATFTVYLPEASSAGMGQPARSAQEEGGEASANRTVLVVDDNEMIREMIVELLNARGYRALAAETPVRAREIALAAGGGIDLLVTDVVMPEMNGPELYESLAVHYPSLPVLFISGYTHDLVLRKGVLEEAVDFLPKPFTSEQFLKVVGRVFNDVATG